MSKPPSTPISAFPNTSTTWTTGRSRRSCPAARCWPSWSPCGRSATTISPAMSTWRRGHWPPRSTDAPSWPSKTPHTPGLTTRGHHHRAGRPSHHHRRGGLKQAGIHRLTPPVRGGREQQVRLGPTPRGRGDRQRLRGAFRYPVPSRWPHGPASSLAPRSPVENGALVRPVSGCPWMPA